MKTIIVISCLFGVVLVEASVPLVALPLAYAKLEPGAPIGLDGRVVDTPEVAFAKAEHAAAHFNEKLRHTPVITAYASPAIVAPLPVLKSAAPLGVDGRVVDTAEVALAKAEHAAAHAKELSHAAKSVEAVVVEPKKLETEFKMQHGAPIGMDGQVVDTPEVALAKAEHAAAHLNEKLRKTPVVTAYASPAITPIVATLPIYTKAQSGAPIGLDGRVVDTAEVAFAKAEHAAAHFNARLENAAEDFKNIAASNYIYYSSPYIHYYY